MSYQEKGTSIPNPNPIIESARTYETAIEIIPKEVCEEGMQYLIHSLQERFPDPSNISLIPILEGGGAVGIRLADALGIKPNFMQMKLYPAKEGEEMEKIPKCLLEPDIKQIINTGVVVFTEAVIESQRTIIASMEKINKMIDLYNTDNGTTYPYPEYHTFALISKINGEATIPNLEYAFSVDKDIWVFGLGCDDEGKGREKDCIMGRLSPFATTLPIPPYFIKHFDAVEERVEEELAGALFQ